MAERGGARLQGRPDGQRLHDREPQRLPILRLREQLQLSGASVAFQLDGRPVEAPADGSLLAALRDGLGRTCVKDGCAPQGQCGACSVLIDGAPRLACVTPVTRVQGKEVTTVEGLREPLRTCLAAAICREDAFVCGFCIPGVVVRLHSLLEGTPRPSRDEIAKAIASNLCRCTGWQTIVDAVASCGVGAEDEASKAREEDLDVVLGRHRYVADAHDVELWAAPLCAGVPAGALRGISGEGLLTATAIGSWLPEDSVVREGGQIRDPGDIIINIPGTSATPQQVAVAVQDGVLKALRAKGGM
ncbi:MAG: hypothetical protein DYH08_15895 [Actinobacteria bacterium ATB1]|nr:hypothetical protein [Actinobacteria bacterium ATB1]